MIRTVVAAAYFVYYMITRRISHLIHVTILGKSTNRMVTWWVKDFSGRMLHLALTDFHVEGRERVAALPADRPVVVVSSHESWLDIPAILNVMERPVGFIAKEELARIPLLGFWIRALGGKLLDRSDLRASHELFTRGVTLAPGQMLLIFPEGTRNKASTVAPFKPGSLRPAFENDALVLPVCVCGGRRKFEGNRFCLKRGPIYVEVFPPVDIREVAAADKRRFAEELHERVAAAHRRWSALL